MCKNLDVNVLNICKVFLSREWGESFPQTHDIMGLMIKMPVRQATVKESSQQIRWWVSWLGFHVQKGNAVFRFVFEETISSGNHVMLVNVVKLKIFLYPFFLSLIIYLRRPFR